MANGAGALLIVLTFLAAGCLSSTPEGPATAPDEEPTRTSGPSDPSRPAVGNVSNDFIELVDCTYFPVSFQVPQATVEHAVPSAYEPVGFAPDLAQMNLFLLDCQDFAVSNQTVGRSVTLATLVVRVEPPPAAAAGAEIHYYRVESYISDEALAVELSARGAEAVHGSVSWTREETSFTAMVATAETLVYEVTGGYGLQTAPIEKTVKREHYGTAEAAYAWVDSAQTSQIAAWPSPAAVTAETGLLSQAWTDASPAVGGIVSEGTFSAILTFHQEPAESGR